MNNKVTFLDDNEDLQVIMGRILKLKLDVDLIAISSVQELIERSDEVLSSDLTILDMNLGTDGSGLDAYEWLNEHHYEGKSFFLTGYDESNPLVEKATHNGAKVYQKPLHAAQLLSLISKAIQPKELY